MTTGGAHELSRLAGELAATQQELSGLLSGLRESIAVQGSATGRDQHDAAIVTLDGTGAVERFSLGADWREDVGTAGLGAAIVQAYQAAVAERTGRWTEHLEEVESAGPQRGAPVSAPERPLGDPTTAAAMAALDELRDLAARAEAQIGGLETAAAAQADSSSTAASPDRSVHVHRQRDLVVRVDIDQRWAENAGDSVIERTVQAALARAVQDADPAASDPFAAFPDLAAVRDLTKNPDELMRRLGVIR